MKKKYIIIGLLFVVTATAVFYYLSKNEYNSTTASCDCESNWFPHEQTPPPAEGDGSPFDTDDTTNCIFHQWSWQKFLWLTKPTPSGQPLFIDSLHLVSSKMELVAPQLNQKLVLKDINQAGFSGVLVSNSKYNQVVDTVFYSIHINTIFKDKAELMAKMIHSGKLPYSNLETFPVGAFELKVSWISTSAIPNNKLKDYYTTKAAVITKSGKYVLKEVALLGMHVVGVVKNHPEFIWATFEHKDLAPIYDLKNNQVSTTNEMLFSEKGNSNGLGGITWDTIKKQPLTPNKAFILYNFGVPRVLGTNDFMKTSQAEPANFDNITNINNCVAAKLQDVFKNYFYNGSIWLNTDKTTAKEQAEIIVTRKLNSVLPDSLARGSSNLANITMETYTQTFKKDIHEINAGNLANCFSCHQASNFEEGSAAGKSPLYLSHIFKDYLFATKPTLLKTQSNAKVKMDAKVNLDVEIRELKLIQFKKIIKEHE